MSIHDGDRPPFFYFVKNGGIVTTVTIPEWNGEGCAIAQEKYPDCQMWAYRFNGWIKYDRFHGVFDIRDLTIPDCLKLVLLLESDHD